MGDYEAFNELPHLRENEFPANKITYINVH